MTQRAAVRDAQALGPGTLATATLLALLAGIAHVALRPAPDSEPSIPNAAPDRGASAAAATGFAVQAPVHPPVQPPVKVPLAVPVPTPVQEAPTSVTSATPPRDRAIARPADRPYRFIGRSTVGAETSIVLFGRGRTVHLRGPGPLDEEHVVEVVLDDYVVIRHTPTGVGTFLALAPRQPVAEPPRDPEDSPRD